MVKWSGHAARVLRLCRPAGNVMYHYPKCLMSINEVDALHSGHFLQQQENPLKIGHSAGPNER